MYLTQLQSQNEENMVKNYNAVGQFLSGSKKEISTNFFAAEPLFELGDWMAKPNTADLHYLSGMSTDEIYQGSFRFQTETREWFLSRICIDYLL